MRKFPLPLPGEVLITQSAELLHRACPAPHFDREAALPTSEMFRVTKHDEGKLSVARETAATPNELYAYRVRTARRPPAGVWSVQQSEVVSVGLRAIDDIAIAGPDAAPGHSYIDHRCEPPLSDEEREAMQSRLLLYAIARPCFRV